MVFPQTLEFAGFRLVGSEYKPIPELETGWRWSQQLGLYLGVVESKLRYLTQEGKLVTTPEEVALQERQRADSLAEYLRALGVDPDKYLCKINCTKFRHQTLIQTEKSCVNNSARLLNLPRGTTPI